MNREDIIRMAREAGLYSGSPRTPSTGRIIEKRLERFAALVAAAERNKLAQWMIDRSYATGHGDTVGDLLQELEWQVRDSEREACAKVCADGIKAPNYPMLSEIAAAIRARGETK